MRLANDANCFALSEASDGAAAGAGVVFGVIAGTGVGGGVVVDGKVLDGAHGIGGEWGHNPLPAHDASKKWTSAPLCYCGKRGCMEIWCSGPGLGRGFQARHGGATATRRTDRRVRRRRKNAPPWTRWIDRFARALATVVNILDPDVIVLGGGLSNIERLYRDLPPLVETYAFNLERPPRIVKNMHGDSSGVRGAAWLWPRMSDVGGLARLLPRLPVGRVGRTRPAPHCGSTRILAHPELDTPRHRPSGLRRLLCRHREARRSFAERQAADRGRRDARRGLHRLLYRPHNMACVRPCRCSRPAKLCPQAVILKPRIAY